MAVTLVLFLFISVSSVSLAAENRERSFGIDYKHNRFIKDGQGFRYISGSIHYFRVPQQYWEDRLKKMAAAGLNAVQIYIAWNIHEPSPGHYNFSGQQNVSEFLEIAQSYNLSVILRTGPYICAEWEYGGLPAWLLTENPNVKVRTSDPSYLKPVDSWLDKLYTVLKPHLYKNGGNIISIQIENEYGSFYACDYDYLRFLRKKAIDSVGEDVVLFTVDGDGEGYLKCGTLQGLYTTVDFGITSDPAKNFKVQREWEPQGPLVNTEYYTGWMDHWGKNHSVYKSQMVATSLDRMLALGANVNLYMFEGGTNFGFWSGANYPFQPVPTSYDYDAPLSEAGDITEKYMTLRQVISKIMSGSLLLKELFKIDFDGCLPPSPSCIIVQENCMNNALNITQQKIVRRCCANWEGGLCLPTTTSYDHDAPMSEAGDITVKYWAIRKVISKYNPPPAMKVPPSTPKYAYGKVQMKLFSSLYKYITTTSKPVDSAYPLTMEQIRHYYGYILYRHQLVQDVVHQTLNISGVRDRGYIWLTSSDSSVPVGVVDRIGNTTVNITASKGQYLCILVENQGRVNYGTQIDDNLKGLISNVTLSDNILSKWQQFPVIVSNEGQQINFIRFSYNTGETIVPSIFGGTFIISGEPEDTYLDMSLWTKGQLLINGHNIGRYWPTKGPQVRLYVPKFFLKTGLNEVVMIELERSPCGTPSSCMIDFKDQPLINGTVIPNKNLDQSDSYFDQHLYH